MVILGVWNFFIRGGNRILCKKKIKYSIPRVLSFFQSSFSHEPSTAYYNIHFDIKLPSWKSSASLF